MGDDPRARITEILTELETSQKKGISPQELLPMVYEDMRRLAGSFLRRERPGHTLRATELVHEAYLRLVDQTRVDWKGRTHFFAIGAQAMRRLLVDYARRRVREKHGGGQQRIRLEGLDNAPGREGLDPAELLTLEGALKELAVLDERQAKVVELRCFAGLKVDEIALALGISRRSVEGDWTHARAWLRRKLAG